MPVNKRIYAAKVQLSIEELHGVCNLFLPVIQLWGYNEDTV